MSPVAAGLDGLLALLLVAALVLGARLNRRLKSLRDGQAGFAAAVLELNQAAARAEAGLSALKTAQEDAHEELLGRIEVARGLAAKLERVGAEAERRAAAPSERTHEAPPLRAAAPSPTADALAPGGALAAIAALAGGRSAGRNTATADPAPERAASRDEAPPAAPGFPPRRRPVRGAFDDELFEAPSAKRDDPLGFGALERSAAARPSPPPTRPAPALPTSPRAPDGLPELGPLTDPLSKWKTVR